MLYIWAMDGTRKSLLIEEFTTIMYLYGALQSYEIIGQGMHERFNATASRIRLLRKSHTDLAEACHMPSF